MRFPNLSRYSESEQKIVEADENKESENRQSEHKDSIRLHKTEKWISQADIDKEETKVYKMRSHTSAKKKFDTDRLIKPTYSSLKRGRVLPRDPITK